MAGGKNTGPNFEINPAVKLDLVEKRLDELGKLETSIKAQFYLVPRQRAADLAEIRQEVGELRRDQIKLTEKVRADADFTKDYETIQQGNKREREAAERESPAGQKAEKLKKIEHEIKSAPLKGLPVERGQPSGAKTEQLKTPKEIETERLAERKKLEHGLVQAPEFER